MGYGPHVLRSEGSFLFLFSTLNQRHTVSTRKIVDLGDSMAGQLRVNVGNVTFSKWYAAHTSIHQVLRAAFESASLRGFNLRPETAVILRVEAYGLIEVAEPHPR